MSEKANILVSISALPKTGKTYLALTFPDPIKVYSFDQGAAIVRRQILKKYPKKVIDIHNFVLPIIDSEHPDPWALGIWDEFYKEYRADVEGGKYKTLVIDPATTVETVLRQAILEELQDNKPNKQKLATSEYGARNLRMTALFSRARNNGVNLVVIQYLKEKWEKIKGTDKAEPTGEMTLDGWNQTEGQVDIILEMTLRDKAGKTVMLTTIKANRFDRDQRGKTYEDTTYDELYAVLVPEED